MVLDTAPSGRHLDYMYVDSIGHGLIRGAWLLGALSIALNVSCGSSNPESVRDTTGATFSWTCSDDGCRVEPIDAPPPALCDSSKVFYSWFQGNFIEICSAASLSDDGSWGTDASLCRLVACDSVDECPQWQGAEYACSAGLCQNIEPKGERIGGAQVVALCMAEEPRPAECRAQLLDPEVASEFARADASCESFAGPCTVPAECRQP